MSFVLPFTCLSVCVSVRLSFRLPICLSFPARPSTHPPVIPSVCPSVCFHWLVKEWTMSLRSTSYTALTPHHFAVLLIPLTVCVFICIFIFQWIQFVSPPSIPKVGRWSSDYRTPPNSMSMFTNPTSQKGRMCKFTFLGENEKKESKQFNSYSLHRVAKINLYNVVGTTFVISEINMISLTTSLWLHNLLWRHCLSRDHVS